MARLGELERKVMEVLWAHPGAVTAREVGEEMPEYAYTTLLTVLDRLQGKRLVFRVRDGRAFRYAPVTSREDYTAELMREALGATTDRSAALVRFAETVSPKDAQVLRRALGELTGEVGAKGGGSTP